MLLLFAKSHARLTCSVVNALTTVRCRYQLFASCVGVSPPAKTVKTSPPQAAYRLRRLFCKSRRVRSLRCSSCPKKVTPRLRCSLAGALATLRLANNLFRAAWVQSCQGNFRKNFFHSLFHVGASFVSLAPAFFIFFAKAEASAAPGKRAAGRGNMARARLKNRRLGACMRRMRYFRYLLCHAYGRLRPGWCSLFNILNGMAGEAHHSMAADARRRRAACTVRRSASASCSSTYSRDGRFSVSSVNAPA